MAMSTTIKAGGEEYIKAGGEEYISLEERIVYDSYVQMVNDWNEDKRFHIDPDSPPPDAPIPKWWREQGPPDARIPKWRGQGLLFAKVSGPRPGYGIPHRARDIARYFEKKDDWYSYYDGDEEDEQEEKHTVEWLKGVLDELQAYDVESIDVATVLHSFGCLITFLRDVFSQKHACIRAKAAELITSMVQNHPTSQQLLIEANALQLLLHNFTTDPDTTSRTKALGAISSLIRNNESGVNVFLRENGYEALRNASGSSTHNDEVVDLIGYLRRESSLCLKFGDDDSDVHEARNSGQQLGKNVDKPKPDNLKIKIKYDTWL